MYCKVPNDNISLGYKSTKMKKQVLNRLLLFGVILLAGRLNAQDKEKSDSLYGQIAHMDSVLFTAFNNRDLETFKALFTPDLEFYHDKGGLTGYRETIDFMEAVAKNNNGLRRELVPGSLEVYPIPNYGAMEIGAHTFCHMEKGKQDCGTFKFVHIWKRVGNGWKITRVISYNH
jgi:hypothetical protein